MKNSVTVLMYHHILPKDGFIASSVDNFDKQMKFLSDNNYKTLSSEEFFLFKKGELKLPKKSVFITFDDGWRDNFIYAYPILKKYNLKAIQLHGNESPELCKELKSNENVEIIKVFSVGEKFDFETIEKYEEVCDYFLFDTKGEEKGGNGVLFNWKLLNNYSSEKPYFLSGGIGLDDVQDIHEFFKTDASKFCIALDLNSKFEVKPGLKNINKLESFIKKINYR